VRLVIPCWNFGDHLATTLPKWITMLGNADPVLVVTHPDDAETAEVAKHHGVKALLTDAWTQDGAQVNKAAALDDAFSDMQPGELCFSVDADSLPDGRLPYHDEIAPHTVYGCRRYSPTGNFQRVANIPYITRHGRGDSPESCGGYFQAFRYDPSRSFGSYPTAAGYDYFFAFAFPHGATLDCLRVIHLAERRIHWKGRQR